MTHRIFRTTQTRWYCGCLIAACFPLFVRDAISTGSCSLGRQLNCRPNDGELMLRPLPPRVGQQAQEADSQQHDSAWLGQSGHN